MSLNIDHLRMAHTKPVTLIRNCSMLFKVLFQQQQTEIGYRSIDNVFVKLGVHSMYYILINKCDV